MKKIPCLYLRDFTPPRTSVILDSITPGCEWVIAGEGAATAKWDGTAVAIRDGKLYARYDAKRGKTPPQGAIPCCDPDPDPVTGHHPHWVLATRPEDIWIREAACLFLGGRERDLVNPATQKLWDGTYEAVGPKFQGNPHGFPRNTLRRHGAHVYDLPSRTSTALHAFFIRTPIIEGLVFHHPDGRMCKIRRVDFGLSWPRKKAIACQMQMNRCLT